MPVKKQDITGGTVKNIGGRKHPEYDKLIDLWNFLMASYRGGLGMQGRSGMDATQVNMLKPSGYYAGLFRFKRESTDDYIVRTAQTPYRPYARKIIQAFANYVCKEEPEREGTESFADLIENCDRKGSSLLAFTRGMLALQSAIGEINILVDMPSPDREIISKYDQTQAGLNPYCIPILPQNIVDWSINVNGKYDWVIIEQRYIENLPTSNGAEAFIARTYWDAEKWELYRSKPQNALSVRNDNTNAESWEFRATGVHPCGECPVIRASAEDIDNTPLTPESWSYDLFDINRAIYNLESIDLVNLYYQTFGQLVLPRQSFVQDNEIQLASVSEAFTETPEEKGLSRYIQPTGAESAAIGNKIQSLKSEMYNVSGLFHRTDSKVAESAESKAWDFEEVNQFLAQLAKTADWIEERVITIAGKWRGMTATPKVNYKKDYKIEDIEKTVAAILDLKTIGFSSETGRKEVTKKVYRDLLPEATPEIMTTIEKEVDESEEENPLTMFDANRPEVNGEEQQNS